ncbi:MAG TPA: hypothetical protein VE077_04480, partial [Candidatus Methylomirabilis sp.]|nr:hypothetical protein [Candidatus Methylomirabilis sp.]
MNHKLQSFLTSAMFLGALSFAVSAVAQERRGPAPQPDLFYNLSRETVLQGTVVSYTEASNVAPLGPHVKIQTSSGVVDVHLGDAHLLEANHLTLAAGDSIKVVGETVPFGKTTQFVARVIQKGAQSVVLRSTR